MIRDTVIKWENVNMRVKDKHLPEQGKRIVYYNQGICVGVALENAKGQLCVGFEYKRQAIKTGFLWCYQENIKVPEEE